ncbi:MAG TPA: GNAT family N-acetyltransferase [Acidimicrobiales bacterium]|nr:GNAT family N-acetyltransferase [Acidimicrobiales bacterium]
MAPSLRTATLGDVDALLALWREAGSEPTHTDDAPGVSGLMAHDPEAVVVAVDGDRVVGSVIAGWDGWRGSIYRIAVAPSHRRAGVARALIKEAERRLDGRGARRTSAIVVSDDAQAMAFWRASGWEQQRERARFVRG